jgi:hypothetical protein
MRFEDEEKMLELTCVRLRGVNGRLGCLQRRSRTGDDVADAVAPPKQRVTASFLTRPRHPTPDNPLNESGSERTGTPGVKLSARENGSY